MYLIFCGKQHQNGKEASKVYLTGAYISSPYFIYDQAKGEYTRYQFSDVQIDGNTNQPVTVENLFRTENGNPLYRRCRQACADYHSRYRTGYYINDGKYIEIQWSRETDWSKFVFTANGEEIKVARVIPGYPVFLRIIYINKVRNK